MCPAQAERYLVGLQERLQPREVEAAALRRNVGEKTELVTTLHQQLQEVKREMANAPPAPHDPNPMWLQGLPADVSSSFGGQ